MESNTRIHLHYAMLYMLVKNAFGSKAAVSDYREIKEGYFNTVFEIQLTNGMETILKVAPHGDKYLLSYEKDLMQTEILAMQLARDQGLPVPALLYSDNSRNMIPNAYLFMEKVPGAPWNLFKQKLPAEINQALERELGELCARIHKITGPEFGFINPRQGRSFPGWQEAFRYMLHLLLADAAHYAVPLPCSVEPVLSLLETSIPLLNEVTTPHLVHRDLRESHIFIDPTGGQPVITGLIDWERAFFGDPVSEYYIRLLNDHSPFWEGYGCNLLQTAAARQLRQLYDLYLFLVLYIEAIARGYPDKSFISWAAAELQKICRSLLLV